MSLILDAERLAMRLLPPGLTKSLQELKHRLPLRLVQAPPVVQIYLDDAHTQSFVGINNFYSCLLAGTETAAKVELRFYAASGKRVLTHALELAHCAAEAVDVHALFATHRVRSPFGVVTVQITPRAPRRQVYRELGQVAAQFFVFFRDRDSGSVGQTHPLSLAERAYRPSGPFTSSQVISTAQLEQLIAYQYNPSGRPHMMEHALVDLATGAKVASQRLTVPALGSSRSLFALATIAGLPAQLGFTTDSLPSGNSKPMLRRVFAGGKHSVSHA